MTLTTTAPRVAIVGGGITGLAAAWELQKAGVDYTLFEKGDRWGGKILTDRLADGFVVEAGPDSFITQKPWALQLAQEMGLEDRLLDTNDDRRKVFVLNRGRPIPLPDGVMLIVPTKLMPFVLTPLFSLPAKMRMGFDLILPAKRDGEDETVADFITRRLGAEALDKLAEPLMSGIYNAEAARQSVLATFPRFRQIEEKHGSLILGMLAARRNRPKKANPDKRAMFVSMRGGTQELVEELVERLTGDLRLNAGVSALEPGYRLRLDDGSAFDADVVILTAPAFAAAQLVRPVAPAAARDLEAIRYVSTGTMSLAFRREEFSHPLNGFGLVIPRSENRRINAVTWTSTKFDHRAPDDHVLLRVFFGGSRRPEMMEASDDDLTRIVDEELADVMGIRAEPVFRRIYRWHRSNPQYDVNHLDRMDRIETDLPEGLLLAGSAYRGIGIPDCVRQGREAARQAVEQVTVSP
ncbi:MAG: protoporphyrinogen oxidase [Anaerolineae bacterium]